MMFEDRDAEYRKLLKRHGRWYRRLFRWLLRRDGRIVLHATVDDALTLKRAAKRLNVSVSELALDLILKNLPKETGVGCRHITAEKPSDFPPSLRDVEIRGVCMHTRRKSLPCHWPPGLERQCPYFSE